MTSKIKKKILQIFQQIGFFLSLNTNIEIGQTRKYSVHDDMTEAILICLYEPLLKLLIALVKC